MQTRSPIKIFRFSRTKNQLLLKNHQYSKRKPLLLNRK
jgi:hypothetical protein